MKRVPTVYLPLVLAYGATWPWIWGTWHFRDAYYEYAPLVVSLAVLWVAWHRRRFTQLEAQVEPRAWWLLGPGLLMHLAGAALAIDSLSAASLVLSVPGAVLLTEGGPRFRRLLPVLGLLPFVVPLPLVASGRVAFELKEIAIEAGLAIANVCGADGLRDRASIAFHGLEGTLPVADACSGLRSLLALVTLGYVFAFFFGEQRGARRWVILLAAGPIAVVTNALRIAMICVIARYCGVPAALGTGHDLANLFEWVIDLAALLALDAALTRRRRS
jgi:exosortase